MRNKLLYGHGAVSRSLTNEESSGRKNVRHGSLAHLSEHFRRGQVMVLRKESGNRLLVEKLPRQNYWNIPSFDLGYLFDENSPDRLNTAKFDSIEMEVKRLALEGKIYMPFQDCAFIARLSETNDSAESTTLVRVKTDDEVITGEVFVWCFRKQNPHIEWHKQPFKFTLSSSGLYEIEFHDQFKDNAGRKSLARFVIVGRECAHFVAKAVVLLSEGEMITEHCEYTARINRKRSLNRLGQLPQTIRVRLGAAVGRRGAASPGTGSGRQPHDRRGHYRKLASGQVVFVNASKINGGADRPRSYEVVAPPKREMNN